MTKVRKNILEIKFMQRALHQPIISPFHYTSDAYIEHVQKTPIDTGVGGEINSGFPCGSREDYYDILHSGVAIIMFLNGRASGHFHGQLCTSNSLWRSNTKFRVRRIIQLTMSTASNFHRMHARRRIPLINDRTSRAEYLLSTTMRTDQNVVTRSTVRLLFIQDATFNSCCHTRVRNKLSPPAVRFIAICGSR